MQPSLCQSPYLEYTDNQTHPPKHQVNAICADFHRTMLLINMELFEGKAAHKILRKMTALSGIISPNFNKLTQNNEFIPI